MCLGGVELDGPLNRRCMDGWPQGWGPPRTKESRSLDQVLQELPELLTVESNSLLGSRVRRFAAVLMLVFVCCVACRFGGQWFLFINFASFLGFLVSSFPRLLGRMLRRLSSDHRPWRSPRAREEL